MQATLVKTFHFDAAHRLPNLPEGHKCRRLHGHTFRLEVAVEGEVDPRTGMVMDYGEIKAVAGPVVEQLDHQYLNEIPGLENPSSEVLARWIWDRLAPRLPGLAGVTVLESCSARCEYRGKNS
jgi:6-pyruvoyltetrahydropterin/6-carboxytetrahydropterin synthase